MPPGSILVTIVGSTIQGANDHGIFVQDSAAVLITGNLVEHNCLAPHTCAANQTSGCISEDKAIELVGTSGSVVASNLVQGNMADGGIGIADDGPIDPGALLPGTLLPIAGSTVPYTVVVNHASHGSAIHRRSVRPRPAHDPALYGRQHNPGSPSLPYY